VTAKEERPLHQQQQPLETDSLCWCQLLQASVNSLFPKLSQTQWQRLSPTTLAYLGDAIYELYVRMYYSSPPKRSEIHHRLVVAQVRAEKQALHLQTLAPHLQQKELEIVRRGRNAASGGPKRVDPKIYQQATSFETLIGYLYLTDCQRLAELLQKLNLEQ
jgi:ribonuclease-3 family protein